MNTRGTESELVFSDLNSATSTVKVPVRYFGVESGFFMAECELGREITVTKDGFVCGEDGNPTDRNYVNLTIVGGEGLEFFPLHINYTATYGEENTTDSRANWNITCEEISTRSTLDVKQYKVTFGSVPPAYDYGTEKCTYLRAYLTLVSQSVKDSYGAYWKYMVSDYFLSSGYEGNYKTYFIKPGVESYVFTFNVKDALTE